ncbi:MAG: hypothetical protein MRERV_46c002 [Mycoplasmataceae bacterium RV_VA103A]|nr:MAG: hypothetical protein MRERV_46c002 [Mycoplasmataceae bacterium RV_VA103A]
MISIKNKIIKMTYCKAISCYQERLPTPPKPSIFLSIITFGMVNILTRERLWCSYHSECLGKVFEKTNISNSFDLSTEVCEMETFETWFNKKWNEWKQWQVRWKG